MPTKVKCEIYLKTGTILGFISIPGISSVNTALTLLSALTYKKIAQPTKENVKYSTTEKLIRSLDGSMESTEQAANVSGFISGMFIISGHTMVNEQ